jgi:hypothetical protein
VDRNEASGLIEVDLFPEDVDSLKHPEVIRFRELLEDVALEYHCRLMFFEIEQGTVSFAFDSDDLMTDIMKFLQNGSQSQP